MDFVITSIVSGIVWDTIKKGISEVKSMLLDSFYVAETSDKTKVDDFATTICENMEGFESEQEVYDFIVGNSKLLQDISALKPKTEFSCRIQFVVKAINQALTPVEPLNYEKLGYMLGMPSCEEMKKYYRGELEPDYSLEEKIARLLGVRSNWLEYGSPPCFGTLCPGFDIHRIEECIEQNRTKKIFLVCSKFGYPNETYGGLFMILQESEYSFHCIDMHAKMLSPNVGESGADELMRLIDLLYMYHEDRDDVLVRSELFCVDYDVSERITGGTHPFMVIRESQIEKGFLTDCFDCVIDESQDDYYKNKRGDEFVEICRTVRRKAKNTIRHEVHMSI